MFRKIKGKLLRKVFRVIGLIIQKGMPRLAFPKINRFVFSLQGYSLAKTARVCSTVRMSGNISIYIGDHTFIGDNSSIVGGGAGIIVGSNCDISDNVIICSGTHKIGGSNRRAGDGCGYPVIIGNGVWVGVGAIILPGVSVGNGCIIGAGALVNRSFPDNMLIAGNPARIIRELS